MGLIPSWASCLFLSLSKYIALMKNLSRDHRMLPAAGGVGAVAGTDGSPWLLPPPASARPAPSLPARWILNKEETCLLQRLKSGEVQVELGRNGEWGPGSFRPSWKTQGKKSPREIRGHSRALGCASCPSCQEEEKESTRRAHGCVCVCVFKEC